MLNHHNKQINKLYSGVDSELYEGGGGWLWGRGWGWWGHLSGRVTLWKIKINRIINRHVSTQGNGVYQALDPYN